MTPRSPVTICLWHGVLGDLFPLENPKNEDLHF